MLDNMVAGFWQAFMGPIVKFLWFLASLLWVAALSLSFCFTSNHFISDFETSSFITKNSIHLVRSFRHNCRIVWGVILPIDPSMYPGISSAEINYLPQAKNALYQFPKKFAPLQENGLKLIALQTLALERNVLGIFMESESVYANTLLSKMQLSYDWTRAPASDSAVTPKAEANE